MLNPQLNIYCDGGARGNPGPAASAFVVVDSSGQTIHEQGIFLGTATNNQAEYQAVIAALNWLLTNCPTVQQCTFYLDSLLVVNQLNGSFKIKDPFLKQKSGEVKNLLDQLGQLEIRIFKYIPRIHNTRADYLVNQTLDSPIPK